MNISDKARVVLSACKVEDDQVLITGGQLDRKLYLEVNAVLEALGGKWNRRLKAHVFEASPVETLSAAIESGEVVSNVKALAFYATPAKIASDMVFDLGVCAGTRVLEPSAGEGDIAIEARFKGGVVTCVEIDPKRAETLRSRGFTVHEGDFLKTKPLGLFDCVVMNPPFAVAGRARADLDHVEKAFEHLAPGGKLAAIMSGGILFREDARSVAFRAAVHHRGGQIKALVACSFKGAGTNVNTCIVTMRRPS